MIRIIYFILALVLCNSLKAQVPPTPPLGPGEQWTNLWSVSYDFQTNGSIRYLLQNPNNLSSWCAILMAQQDSNTALGVQRYIYYSYSNNNGDSWTPDVLNTSSSFGFPCITLSNGSPVIACHRSSQGSFVYKDSLFGAYNIVQIGTAFSTFQIWPHIAGTTSGNLVMAASENVMFQNLGYRTTYNGISWSPFLNTPLISGPSGNFDVASGPNGKVAILGTDYFQETNKLAWYQSNNNGLIFDAGSIILPFIVDGNDTLYANVTGGFQAVYDNSGNAHIVFVAYNIYNAIFPNFYTTAFIKPGLYHWTSQNNSITKIAGKNNILNLADTITQYAKVPLCQPTITWTASGKLICAFTAFLRGNTQIVNNGDTLNTGEIFYTVSNDGGVTWAVPQNITKTTDIEEKHPSLSPSSSSDSLRVFYVRDMKAGEYVNLHLWGNAPVYGIFYNQNFNPVPATPLLLNPPNNSNYVSLTPILDWNNAARADSYRIQLSRNDSFTNIIIDQANLTVSQYQIPSSTLNYDSVYYWKVNGTNSIGTGQWSAVWGFRTRTFLPPAPALISPPNGAIGISLTPRLDWSDAPTAESYTVQVSSDSNFINPLINQSNLISSQYFVPPSVLSMNTTYYWRVNSTNSNGTGYWSTTWNFRSLITGIHLINNLIPEEYHMYDNYPNPFNPETKIRFDLSKPGFTYLMIYDMRGREIVRLVNETLNAGSYEYIFSADKLQLSSGVYYYKLISGEYIDTKKMVLLK